jgi:pimeloyl-ACP methyl ester carboxylesterase
MNARAFEIRVETSVLSDLKNRLAKTRWPEQEASGWESGTDLSYLQQLVAYWKDDYDWRKAEAELNQLPHYKVEIEGIGIHFVHQPGKGPNPLPIILTHGWPDSFIRFKDIIPMLADPVAFGAEARDSFDVVVPSMPGFGFSDKPEKTGTLFQINNLWAELMSKVLGYERFAAHGGDWGSIVTEQLARSHGHAVIGIHLTDVPFIHTFQKPDDLSAAEQEYLSSMQKWQKEQGAYAMIQGTRPQTLAAGLNDSPAALAAWIIEKFQAMNDCGGDLDNCFGRDRLLTNLMLYWVTESIASSFLPYYNVVNAGPTTWMSEKLKEWVGSKEVPAAFALFPRDNTHPPREWAERFFNVQRWTKIARGAHFTAMEEPELLAEDLRAFFRPLRESSHHYSPRFQEVDGGDLKEYRRPPGSS